MQSDSVTLCHKSGCFGTAVRQLFVAVSEFGPEPEFSRQFECLRIHRCAHKHQKSKNYRSFHMSVFCFPFLILSHFSKHLFRFPGIYPGLNLNLNLGARLPTRDHLFIVFPGFHPGLISVAPLAHFVLRSFLFAFSSSTINH
ncbi:hypothetical protein DSECCO2_532020 [anaerobic digester metagenome]